MNAPVTVGVSSPEPEVVPQAQMERMLLDLRRMYHERNQALDEVSKAHHEALLQLSLAAEYKDDDTGVHIVRIGFLSEALALALGQSQAYAEMLRKAAPMHDIGKIGTPDSVLKKPGPLNAEERLIMNRHTTDGAGILGRSRIPLFRLAAEAALTHHERWDGSGYPNRLSGAAIPMSGRIVAVVDFFDALTMDRVYRPAFSVEKALEMMHEQRGLGFDPMVVDAFMENVESLLDLHRRVTDNRMTFQDLVSSEG